jgi:hypothetical protein
MIFWDCKYDRIFYELNKYKEGFKEKKNMKINEKKMYKYFPYTFIREPQKIIIPCIYSFIRSDYDGLILSAATGVGKEACMTSQGLLALEEDLYHRVVFAIATDAGRENKLKELCGVKHGKKVIKVFSKEILCNWMKEKEDERIKSLEEKSCVYDLCNLMGHACEHKDKDCRYQIQKEEIKSADILICDYNYILSRFIREASGFEEIFKNYRTLLFIDECHLLQKRAENIFSMSMSSATLNRAIVELDKFGYNEEKEFIENFLKLVKKEIAKNYSSLKAEMRKNYEGVGELVLKVSDIQKYCGSSKIEELETIGNIFISVGKEISTSKFEKKEGIISYTGMVGKFILRFHKILKANKENSNVFFLKLKGDDSIHIGWITTDVRGFLKNAITRLDKYALYSGTVKPSRLKNDLGLTKEKIFIPESIESPYLIHRKDIILTKERFFHKNLDDEAFIKRILEDLDALLPKMKKPVGIVCTNPVFESLQLQKIYKTLLNEPAKQEEVENWLLNKVPNAELIRYNPYGRIGQSIDLTYLMSIIFLGLPYPKVGKIMQERINKKAKSLKGMAVNRRAWATFMEIIEPAYDRILQSVGRGLRNEESRLNVIYYDVNFKLNKPSLGSKNLVVCDNIEEVISHLGL